jgi:hypothetical protein
VSARNGKIARLPRPVRNELNERLERSEPGPRLLEWLNALKEVKKVVKEDFAGVPISKQNLSEWRQGGFEEWLARRDLCEDARDVTQLAEEMDDQDSQSVLADDVALVLAARFGSLIANWNGEVDQKFEAKSRVLNRLCRSVVQLQRGMHRAIRESFEMQGLTGEKVKRDHEEEKRKLLAPIWSTLRVDAMARMFGGGAAGRKIAKFILAVQNDRPTEDLLPTDKFADEEPSPEEAESVKPAQKEQTVQRATKINPDNADKPLEENEMDGTKPLGQPARCSRFGEGGSKSVKVNQTDLAPISPTRLTPLKENLGPLRPMDPIGPISREEEGAN